MNAALRGFVIGSLKVGAKFGEDRNPPLAVPCTRILSQDLDRDLGRGQIEAGIRPSKHVVEGAIARRKQSLPTPRLPRITPRKPRCNAVFFGVAAPLS